MISLIICSRNSEIPQSLRDNIARSIGIEFELIVIDNSQNKYSIFSAYNEGVKRAKFPFLCFMHDDILYHTQNWGTKVIAHLNDNRIGMIGVLGGHYLSDKPSHFWDSPFISGNCILTNNKIQNLEVNDKYFYKNTYIDVVACDGLWFCLPQKMFNHVEFDECTYSGFHLYDMDISMQVLSLGHSIRVVNDILIEHFRPYDKMKYDIVFLDNQLLFYNKWRSVLPVMRGVIIDETLKTFIDRSCELKSQYQTLWNERNQILNSKAYRLGKLMLKPLKYIKNKIFKM